MVEQVEALLIEGAEDETISLTEAGILSGGVALMVETVENAMIAQAEAGLVAEAEVGIIAGAKAAGVAEVEAGMITGFEDSILLNCDVTCQSAESTRNGQVEWVLENAMGMPGVNVSATNYRDIIIGNFYPLVPAQTMANYTDYVLDNYGAAGGVNNQPDSFWLAAGLAGSTPPITASAGTAEYNAALQTLALQTIAVLPPTVGVTDLDAETYRLTMINTALNSVAPGTTVDSLGGEDSDAFRAFMFSIGVDSVTGGAATYASLQAVDGAWMDFLYDVAISTLSSGAYGGVASLGGRGSDGYNNFMIDLALGAQAVQNNFAPWN